MRIVYKLGTALKITSIINVDTVDSATITIRDPNDTALTSVTNEDMTKEANRTYYYIWQSTEYDSGGMEGVYKAIVKMTIGSYTGIAETTFEMEKL